MTIIEKIDQKLHQFAIENHNQPQRILLHPRDIGNLQFELCRLAGAPLPVSTGPICPHCGKSMLTYAGIPVGTIEEGEAVIE